ncbi:MAG: S8 family serine peptidase [Nocardioides sp.]
MPRLRLRLVALTCATVVALPLSAMSPYAATAATGTLSSTSTTPALPGLSRLLALGSAAERGIVSFDAVPNTAQVRALQRLGLVVQPMSQLPLALVAGTPAQLVSSVTSGLGNDVYPDETLTYLDTESSDTMSSRAGAAQQLRSRGLTGKGVTVGVIDSGCDASHPDLADHVVHNVTLVSPEYVNAGTSPALVVPTVLPPYQNSDLGSGHGTHVAGIIAADGHTGGDHLGVAPDAELACFAIGAVITTTAVVTAFDYILDQPNQLGIDVINNSWGNSFRQFDPRDPVNVATRAVSRKGIVTVFSAGNSGSEDAEASVSPFNQAPWVISVAAGDLARERGGFSSNGLEFDNGNASAIGRDGHTVFTGDRIGNTQPDVMAPGVDISSSCDTAGTVIGPCAPGENASASGTSMASPHVAGAAAVLLQANPRLGYSQVLKAMTATASPVTLDGNRLPSSQVGYGHVNLDRAVALVLSKAWKAKLGKAQRRADTRLRGQDAWQVKRADLWQEDAPLLTVAGSYSRTFAVQVRRGTTALKVAIVYPTPGIATNLASFTGVVKDSAGNVVGATETDVFYSTGVTSTLIKGVKAGRYTVEVAGEYAASDPDTIDSDSINGRVVFLQAAQLVKR